MRGVWWVAMLVVGVAQGQQQQPGQGVNFYSKDQEIAIGRHMAQEFRQQTTPLDSAVVNDYVRHVGSNLAAQFPGGWTYTIETVVHGQQGATHEPTAFPGGPIFVSTDLIIAAQSESEFAGMLAHAMAHVVGRHWTRNATKDGIIGVTPTPDSRGLAVPVSLLSFQRTYEREADYLAVKAMAAAGYDPAGLASYIARVQPAPRGNDVFATLPPRDQRVAAIQTVIGQLPAQTYRANDEFVRVQAEVRARIPAPAPPSLIRK